MSKNNKKENNKSPIKYEKLTDIEHILKRPDMYAGSTRKFKSEQYILDENKIIKKEIIFPPALLRIFIEPLSNAIDNVSVSRKVGKIQTKILITLPEKGEPNIENKDMITILNDGNYIPIEKNEEGDYIHTMIFGQLRTSSNYDDTKDREVGGRNGVGVKILAVLSTFFKVEGIDPEKGLKFTQIWRNNMKDVSEPVIKKTALKNAYTKISYIADMEYFKMKKGYTEDILSLFSKYVYDAAMYSGVKVKLNDKLIKMDTLYDYAKLYTKKGENEKSLISNSDGDDEGASERRDSQQSCSEEEIESICYSDSNSDICIMASDEYEVISFVNGVHTYEGGSHVESWSEAILRPIVNKFNTKKGINNTSKITIKDVKNFFKIFIKTTVINPEFSSQEKTRLTSPYEKKALPVSIVNKIFKWENTKRINDVIRQKEFKKLEVNTKKKRNNVIEKLDNANKSGGKFSSDCTLILCEGDSAKTYAVAGIQKGYNGKVGRDWFGIYPLTGKLLNTTKASPAQLTKNKVITNIIKAIGLVYGTDYSNEYNFKKLNYGKVMIMTDADVDGIHISGLLINLFYYMFNSLFKRKTPYIISMITPIVKITMGKTINTFYDENAFKEYYGNLIKKKQKLPSIKYYKGLGSLNTGSDVKDFAKKILIFKEDKNSMVNIKKVFANDTECRKDWLTNYDKEKIGKCVGNEDGVSRITVSDYIDTEIIKFSLYDCERSMPNVFDGLKPSQRKILYSVFLRNLKYTGNTLKVSQLGAYVAEKTSYHHGEQNLFNSIINMSQDFPGSNNIPLLYRDGQFGTRLEGGNDAASPRYIFTKMDRLTRLIFRPEDDVLLEHDIDDGDVVEPKFYIPIIPMILINGASGIGTGWSTNIPSYNPLEIINCVKLWIKKMEINSCEGITKEKIGEGNKNSPKKIKIKVNYPELIPWYRGYNGSIEWEKNRYISWGILENIEKGKISKCIVSELPIGTWTNTYKEKVLDKYLAAGQIKKYNNHSTPTKPSFEIIEGGQSKSIDLNYETLKLYSYIHISNMSAFLEKGVLKKFDNPESIINTFCEKRYDFYVLRKKYIIGDLKDKLKWSNNKLRFLNEVMNETLIIYKRDEDDVVSEMEEKKYDKKLEKTEKNKNKGKGEEGASERRDGRESAPFGHSQQSCSEEGKKSYNYLLKLPVRSFTNETLERLRKEIDTLLEQLENTKKTNEYTMWKRDLNELIKEYNKMV